MAVNKKTPAKKSARETPSLDQEAKSENTSARRLAVLANQATSLARLVARNPAAPEYVLKKLGSHSDATVRKWVTAHPSTPPSVLIKLATQFPEQLLENPVFDILLLENPDLLNQLPVGTRRSLVKREKCPVIILEWLANDDDEAIHLALAMNPNTPWHVLQELAKSNSKKVANAAQSHVRFNEIGRSKGHVPEVDLSRALALEGLTGPEETAAARMLPWLICVGDREHPGALQALRNWARDQMEALPLASNPHSAAATLASLAGSERVEIRIKVAKNRSAPVAVLERLATDPEEEVRICVAARRDTPPRVLGGLSVDTLDKVRATVAKNPAAPEEILANLAVDKKNTVRTQVAGNIATPPKLLQRLAQDNSPEVRYQIAANACTPDIVLDQLARGDDPCVRAIVARNPATPPRILAKLAKDGYEGQFRWQSKRFALAYYPLDRLDWETHKAPGVRLQVAVNPSTPADVLADLIGEAWPIKYRAATNKNARMRDAVRVAKIARFPFDRGYGEALARHSAAFAEERKYCSCKDPEVLRVLAGSIFPDHRRLVAENPLVPPDALIRLADDENHDVAASLASDWASPEVLQALGNRSEADLRELAAKHESATPDLLRQLSSDKTDAVRKAVAAHQLTPPDVLERLAEDKAVYGGLYTHSGGLGPHIRRAVAMNVSSPPEALRKLAEDTDSIVRFWVATNGATPHSVLEILAVDHDKEVSRASKRLMSRRDASRLGSAPAAKKTKSPPKARAFRQPDAILAGLPGVAHLVADEYVQDSRIRVRRRLAGNPLLPEKHAMLLAKDEVESVRKELADNPGVSDTVLELLANDAEKVVAKAAQAQVRKRQRAKRSGASARARPRRQMAPKMTIGRPLPPPAEADFSRLDDWRHLAGLPPAEITRAIQLDEIPKEQRAARRNELAEAFIAKYSRTNRPTFKRLLCLLLPECPIPVLAKALRSADWKERLATASHPKTPPAIRQRLASDGNEFVRAAAQAALGIESTSGGVTVR